MIESFSQMDSKMTACCHFMQPIENRLVPSMLAAGASRRIAVRIFCENEFCNSNGLFTPPAYISTRITVNHIHLFKRLALINF